MKGAVPPLERVRAAVTREWEVARREELNAELYRKMRAKHAVVVESE